MKKARFGMNVSIAIPAYNEEQNIQNLLLSILRQKTDFLSIKSIIVVTDGCTDRTDQKVKELQKKYKKIILKSHKIRLGKVNRLNGIFKLNISDILIIFDADIILGHSNVVLEMYKTLVSKRNIIMVAAHQIPIRENSFISKIIYGAYKVWDDARLGVPNYLHIQNFYGAATAYRKSFLDSLKIPTFITDERGYLYILANKQKGFKYTKKGYIYYRPVHTIHDIRKLSDRSFSKNQAVLASIFGSQVFAMYHLPIKYKINSVVNNLIHDPIFTSLGIILNILLRIFPQHDQLYDKGMWESSRSTKKAIYL